MQDPAEILLRHPGRPVAAPRLLALALTLATPAAMAAPTAAPEYGGQDVLRLSNGEHDLTPCKVNWTSKDGKLYCFSSDNTKRQFLQNPTLYLQRADDFIAANDVQSTEQAMQSYDSEDAKTLVNGIIQHNLATNGGLYAITDPLDGRHLKLAYDGIDFTRTIDGYGFFPDVDFHDPANKDKRYVIDFWVVPRHGQLVVQETRIYKSPQNIDGKWQAIERLPIPWWWIPAQEHPGKVAVARGWQIMSAIEANAAEKTKQDGGVFKIKDDKTGKTLDLVFIDTHQPVRQLDSNGHYFACTDFRESGSGHKVYDIDFWLQKQKDGTMKVTHAKVHKVPEFKDGHWIEVPRYSWKDLGDSHVVP